MRPIKPNRAVACKMIATNSKSFHPKMMRYLQTEIDLMMNIRNDYVLSLIDAKKTSNNIYIFTEFCNGGDLRRLLEAKGNTLNEKATKIIFEQIVKGISYLGKEGIVH